MVTPRCCARRLFAGDCTLLALIVLTLAARALGLQPVGWPW